jgi:hypothetical protein
MPSAVATRNARLRQRTDLVHAQQDAEGSWLEKKLKPSKVTARYPFKGSPLLYATCGFGSLGDALFGYNSGKLQSTFASHLWLEL